MKLRMHNLLVMIGIVALLVLPVTTLAQDGGDNGDAEVPDPLGGATEFASLNEPTDVTIMLDWTPNTNHIGLYVAQAMGYYDEANLNVEIIEPADLQPEAALDAGLVEFGIGFQEFTSFSMAEGLDVVSIAAIIQHNTSGFSTISDDLPLESPSDLEGLTYGGFSFPDLENPMLELLLSCDDATWDEANYTDIGFADPMPLLTRERIDFAWIFFGWQGISASLDGINLDTLLLQDYLDCVPDYYTPILLTTSTMIEDNPEIVRAFVHATARGYADAIQNPAAAAEVLIDAVPELDAELVTASTEWLADQYQADAPRWGQQSIEVWEGFTQFLIDNGLIEDLDVQAAFSNEFLPGNVGNIE